jgi:hypothetical protein
MAFLAIATGGLGAGMVVGLLLQHDATVPDELRVGSTVAPGALQQLSIGSGERQAAALGPPKTLLYIGSPECGASRSMRDVVEDIMTGYDSETFEHVTLVTLYDEEAPFEGGWVPAGSRRVHDPPGKVIRDLGVSLFPVVLVIDESGTIEGIVDPIREASVMSPSEGEATDLADS